LLVYVDDILIMGQKAATEKAVKDLETLYEVKDLGDARFYLGIETRRDHYFGFFEFAPMQCFFQSSCCLRFPLADVTCSELDAWMLLVFTGFDPFPHYSSLNHHQSRARYSLQRYTRREKRLRTRQGSVPTQAPMARLGKHVARISPEGDTSPS